MSYEKQDNRHPKPTTDDDVLVVNQRWRCNENQTNLTEMY